MEFSGNPPPLVFLRFDQPAAQISERGFRVLILGHVD
jgi:hypothetical protein